MNAKMVIIAWSAHSRRCQLLAEKFKAQLYCIQSLQRRYHLAPLRYVLQAIRTYRVLLQEKPAVIVVQNPPIFAVLVVYTYARLWRAHYIIDAHSGALLAPWWKWSLPLHAFLSRRAVTTLVTNEYLAALVQAWHAPACIVADIPARFPPGTAYSVGGKTNVAVINTFSPDEPVDEILKAAAQLPEVQFYITGDPIRARKAFLRVHPDNVTFTGFLPDAQYLGLLRAVQGVMVLTTDDHTMQRGACEAVAIGKPMIISNWPILRAYFNKGAIYVDNSSQGIQEGILQLQADRQRLEQEVLILQRERWLEWQDTYLSLTRTIASRTH